MYEDSSYNKIWGTPVVDNYTQDQTSERVSVFLAQILNEISLQTAVVKDQETFDIVSVGVTPIAGNFICLQEAGKLTQVELLSVTLVSGSRYTVTIATPLDHAYSIAGGCSLQNVNMNKNGSSTPVSFIAGPRGSFSWDINRMLITMVLSTSGDDGLFGNLTALAKGVYFRKEDSETSKNLFNARDNSDFRLEGYDVAYPPRSGGGGSYGMSARITFNGQDRSGVAIRLNGETSDKFFAKVRDNLSTIEKFRVKIQGHVVI